ncbi:hypothetical protein PQX77_016076, partial [Marasmius sp. AFHP31]
MPSIKTGVGLFLYGVYTVLYTLCVYILSTRKRNRYCIHVVLLTALYITATVEVGMKLALYEMDAQLDLENYISGLPMPNELQLFEDVEGTFRTAVELRFGLQIMTSAA